VIRGEVINAAWYGRMVSASYTQRAIITEIAGNYALKKEGVIGILPIMLEESAQKYHGQKAENVK